MATQLAEWVIKFDDKGTPVLAKLDKGLKQIDAQAEKTGKTGTSMMGRLESYAKGFVAWEVLGSVKDGLMALGSEVIQNTANFQKYQAVLANTYGSAKAANEAMALIQDTAATTPFSVNELTEAWVKLSNRGIIPTKNELISLGDFAASTGKSFDQLTEAMLDGSNPERWKEFGVKVSRSNGMVTLSYKGMTETVKDSSAAVTGVIEKWGKMSGIAGNMAAQSKTLGGQISNLGDNYDQLMIALGESNKGFLSFGTQGLSSAIGWLKDMVQPLNATEQGLKDEEMQLRSIRRALLDAKTPEHDRLEMLRKLKQEYPGLIGNIKDEANAIGEVADKLQGQISMIIKKQYYAAREKEIGQIINEAAETEAKAEEYRQKFDIALGQNPALQKDLEQKYTDAKGKVDYKRMAAEMASYNSPAFDAAAAKNGVDKGEFSYGANQYAQLKDLASLANEADRKVAKLEDVISKEQQKADEYADRYGLGGGKSALDMQRDRAKSAGAKSDPSMAGTNITSAAPKILNVNIEAVHKGNNIINVSREDVGRKVREEIRKADLEALSDSSILAGWNGD